MGEAAVHDILKRIIDELSEPDRLLVESRLADRAELEWVKEAEAARAIARERGIDQDAIDRAVEEVRYPSRPGRR